MILIKELITNLEIKGVKDLYKLKPLMEVTSLNINKSEIARELNVDQNALTDFCKIIKELLDPENTQVFYYKKNLHQYLKDNHGYTGSYRNFCELLQKYPEFLNYFKKKNLCIMKQCLFLSSICLLEERRKVFLLF